MNKEKQYKELLKQRVGSFKKKSVGLINWKGEKENSN